MREAGILGIRAGIAASEFQWYIVDGMRVGVAKQRAYSLAESFVGGELEGKIFREAIRYVVVDVALSWIYGRKAGAVRPLRSSPGIGWLAFQVSCK